MQANVLEFTKEFGLVESFPFGKDYSSIKDKIANYFLLKILLFKIKGDISLMEMYFEDMPSFRIEEIRAEYKNLKPLLESTRKVKKFMEGIQVNSNEKELASACLKLSNLVIDYIQALEKTYKADLETLNKLKGNHGKLYSYDEVFN